ncbi:MAG: hypothetical protein U1E48_03110 [Paracoccaceae bacterium]
MTGWRRWPASTGWKFRIRNAFRDGDATAAANAFRRGHQLKPPGCPAAWTRALAEARQANATAGRLRRGVVASCWYGCGNTSLPSPSTIRLGLTAEGRLVLHQGATEIGRGRTPSSPRSRRRRWACPSKPSAWSGRTRP